MGWGRLLLRRSDEGRDVFVGPFHGVEVLEAFVLGLDLVLGLLIEVDVRDHSGFVVFDISRHDQAHLELFLSERLLILLLVALQGELSCVVDGVLLFRLVG